MAHVFQDEDQALALERRTQPDARMTLFLRIETIRGPRTIIASGLPLSAASEIAEALTEAGHYAEFVDQRPQVTMADRVARLKYDAAFAPRETLRAVGH
jgi:hypothetical protein